MKTRMYIILFISGLILTALSFVPFLIAQNTNRFPNLLKLSRGEAIVKGESLASETTLEGRLWLSLKPKNSFYGLVEGYYYDFSDNTLHKIGDNFTFISNFNASNNGKYEVFVGEGIKNSGKESVLAGVYKHIKVFSNNGKTNAHLPTGLRYFSPIEDTDLLSKRTPAINNNGEILYTAIKNSVVSKTDLDRFNLNNWEVYKVSKSKSMPITTGMYPRWVEDNKFLFVKNDGFYIYNLLTQKEARILKTDFDIKSNMKLGSNIDNSIITLSRPSAGEVLIYELDCAVKCTLHRSGIIKAHAFWSVVSPNGNYIAVQAVDWDKVDSDPKPRIEVYNLATGKIVHRVDLDAFVQTAMFLTAWTR